MGCEQAEITLILEAIEDKITYECGDKIKPECYKIIRRVLNDLREHGKEYVRNKYGL